MIAKNVKTRRDYLKQHSSAQGTVLYYQIDASMVRTALYTNNIAGCSVCFRKRTHGYSSAIFSCHFSACSHSILPEYALPCVIHMLAHHPDFKQNDHETLVQFRE